MLDTTVRRLIDRPLDAAGRRLARRGVSADAITIGGFALGMAAAAAVAAGAFAAALVLLALNRLADGLDGAVARHTQPTDRGGYLDITLDFVFYGAFPLAFALHDPDANALAAAVLLASFYANGSAFLAFAAIAARRGWTTARQGRKSIYFLAGLAEGTETILVFALFCLFPRAFWAIALAFAGVCFVSAAARIATATVALSRETRPEDR